jgi:ankyrin repeat protein
LRGHKAIGSGPFFWFLVVLASMLMSSIPTELLILIGAYLDFKDFNRLKRTCSRLWKSLEQYKVKGASQDVWKKANKTQIIKSLLHSVIDFAAEEQIFFIMAAESGNVGIVELLLQDQRFDPSVTIKLNMNAFQIASNEGHLQIVKLLLSDTRVDPATRNNYAIQVASKNEHFQIVELLLADTRVDPSPNDAFAFRMASENGHYEIVQLLLADDRVDPSARDNYAIGKASENGHLHIV